MAAKKKIRQPVRRTSKSARKVRKQPVVQVHRWFNPFHNHVHANLRSWLIVAVAILILVLGPVLFD